MFGTLVHISRRRVAAMAGVALATLLIVDAVSAQQYSAPRAQGARKPRADRTFTRPQAGRDPASQQMANQLYNRNTVSPYLNLLRPQGVNSVPNYQTLVRPQFQQNAINRQRSQQLSGLGQQIAARAERGPADPSQPIRSTGHTSSFLSHGTYFNTYSAR